ncbi:hypothetical protein O3P69_019961 [Scylla paramamosain]|uniref:Uncharacterized protein n=1 Tax=Scylla paramamosain TaxID=85552 RepID=A0AAW0SJR2_SCYPA
MWTRREGELQRGVWAESWKQSQRQDLCRSPLSSCATVFSAAEAPFHKLYGAHLPRYVDMEHALGLCNIAHTALYFAETPTQFRYSTHEVAIKGLILAGTTTLSPGATLPVNLSSSPQSSVTVSSAEVGVVGGCRTPGWGCCCQTHKIVFLSFFSFTN